ncbi:MAG: YHS domain-containing protein [Candidatus Omnitrophica bacterium]|nr:YHS domain-containing protein [Candidatus Omnitrophota bacterium]
MMKKIVLLVAGIIFLGGSGILMAQECYQKTSKTGVPGEKCNFSLLGNQVICPVTGEKFVITEDSGCVEYKGKIYFFCCQACKPKFETNPDKYIKKRTAKPGH